MTQRLLVEVPGTGNHHLYSGATRFGDLIFTAGQVALRADGTLGGSIEDQVELVLDRLERALVAAGGGLDTVLQVTAYLASLDDFPGYNEVWEARMTPHGLPARTTVTVARFPPGMLVELDCVAHVRFPGTCSLWPVTGSLSSKVCACNRIAPMPTANVDAYEVYYEELGEGEPLLLVNGLGCDTTTWAAQTGEFARHYRVIAFDNPGSGQTTGPIRPATTEHYAGVAAGLLDRIGAHGAHVVGLSLGGAIAQQLAVRRPELVRSLSLHATWGRTDEYLASVFRSWQSYACAVPRLELARQLWLWVYTVWNFNDRPAAMAELERAVREHPFPQSPEGFCAQADACIGHDVLDRLAEIQAPTYLSVGDRDHLTPAHHVYAIKERIPHARLRVWQQMGHAPYWEIPEEFNARQLEFLQAH